MQHFLPFLWDFAMLQNLLDFRKGIQSKCNQNIDKSIRDAARSLDLCPRSVDAAAATAPAASTASFGRWLEKLLVV